MNARRHGILKPVFVLALLYAVFSLQACDSGNDTPLIVLETHDEYFLESNYEGTKSCLECRSEAADQVLLTGHWKWQGVASNIAERESEIHGKNNMINNFCIAVPSNEGRCTQCHIGYGYSDNSFGGDSYDLTRADRTLFAKIGYAWNL